MKFSKQGRQNFYEHFFDQDGKIEDFEFEMSDTEDAIFLSVADAKFVKKALFCLWDSSKRNNRLGQAGRCLKLGAEITKRIEQAEKCDA